MVQERMKQRSGSSISKRSCEDQYLDLTRRGRSLRQIRAIAAAREDNAMTQYIQKIEEIKNESQSLF
jgi:rubrerythrin